MEGDFDGLVLGLDVTTGLPKVGVRVGVRVGDRDGATDGALLLFVKVRIT